MADIYENVTPAALARYNSRYEKFGVDVKTLGWGSNEQQRYRFEQTLRSGFDFTGKSLLDIGCGFGDYADFLSSIGQAGSYVGWDINDNLIRDARKKHSGRENTTFSVTDMLRREATEPVADIGIMLGLLNFNLQPLDNLDYSKKMIRSAYKSVRQLLVVDFLSAFTDPNYPKEDFVYYHDPAEILRFCLELTSNTVLKHDYAPIPQKEFMVFLFK